MTVTPSSRRTTKARAASSNCRPNASSAAKTAVSTRIVDACAGEFFASLKFLAVGSVGIRGNHQRHVCAPRQRQFEPARTVGVAAGNLAAALLDRVRNVLAPFGLRMIRSPCR